MLRSRLFVAAAAVLLLADASLFAQSAPRVEKVPIPMPYSEANGTAAPSRREPWTAGELAAAKDSLNWRKPPTWTEGPVLGRYKQLGTSLAEPNCEGCVLEIRTLTNDQVVFETNNGLLGSAHRDFSTGGWTGHAQFAPSVKGWERTVILVRLTFDDQKAKLTLSPVAQGAVGGVWDAFYQAPGGK